MSNSEAKHRVHSSYDAQYTPPCPAKTRLHYPPIVLQCGQVVQGRARQHRVKWPWLLSKRYSNANGKSAASVLAQQVRWTVLDWIPISYWRSARFFLPLDAGKVWGGTIKEWHKVSSDWVTRRRGMLAAIYPTSKDASKIQIPSISSHNSCQAAWGCVCSSMWGRNALAWLDS